MNFICQKDSILQLDKLAQSKKHTVLIEGHAGCGKSYLAKQYSDMLGISDCVFVQPRVDEIRTCIDECLSYDYEVVICIENLDKGTPSASSALLKFVEEPLSRVYIVITCRDVQRIPDTIISRSSVVSVSPPTLEDVSQYAKHKDENRYNIISKRSIWAAIWSFQDVDTVYKLTDSDIDYIERFKDELEFRGTVIHYAWKMSHFEDNRTLPVEILIQYIISIAPTKHIRICAMECGKDIQRGVIGMSAALSKFIFDVKYCC